MTQHPKLAILGFGTMGQSISAGLVEASGYPATLIHAVDLHPAAMKARAEVLGIRLSAGVEAAAKAAEVVLLCVKPNEIKGLLAGLTAAGALEHRPLVVSIAAGITLDFLVTHTPAGTPLVRAMPNTPCSIRRGMTVLAAGPGSHGGPAGPGPNAL